MESKLIRSWRALLGFTTVLGWRQTVRFYIARMRKQRLFSLDAKGFSHPILCRPDNSDTHSFFQVFVERDSDVALDEPPQFIIDGGANLGYASVLYANKYPHAQILAIEPDADNYALACQNCHPYPNVRVLQAGIWITDEPLVIQNPDAESWAFQLSRVQDSSAESIPGYTMKSLLKTSGFSHIDLLKLDIEGAEEEIFSFRDTEWLDDVGAIAVEIHSDKGLLAIQEALRGRNFSQSRQGEKIILLNREKTREKTAAPCVGKTAIN